MEPRNDLDELRSRLDRMDRALARWRRGAVAVVALTVVAIAGAMAAAPQNDLRVTTLRIVDKHGKDRLVLTAEEGIPDMTFLDPSGKARLMIDIAEDRTPVLLFNESGNEKSRLSLGLGDAGHPMLQLYDGTGKKRVMLGVGEKGGPILRILDQEEKLLLRLP